MASSIGSVASNRGWLAEDDAGPAPDWGGPEAARVLRAFFADDRLVGIPAQHAKRLYVEYPEKEVNQLLAVRHADAASLRRYLVDDGFMSRAASVHRLCPRADWPPLPPATDELRVIMAS